MKGRSEGKLEHIGASCEKAGQTKLLVGAWWIGGIKNHHSIPENLKTNVLHGPHEMACRTKITIFPSALAG